MDKRSLVLFSILGIGAVLLLTKKQPVYYQPPVTGNVDRDNKVAQILAAVAAAGGTITAVQKLIEQIQSMSDSQTSQYYNQVSAGGGTPSYLPDGTTIDYSSYA